MHFNRSIVLGYHSISKLIGDHFGVEVKRNGDHFGVDLGIISGAVQYLARPRDEHCSWYHFASKNGNVPVVSNGSTQATWPLNEDYCRTMLLLRWPSWFDIKEVKGYA